MYETVGNPSMCESQADELPNCKDSRHFPANNQVVLFFFGGGVVWASKKMETWSSSHVSKSPSGGPSGSGKSSLAKTHLASAFHLGSLEPNSYGGMISSAIL